MAAKKSIELIPKEVKQTRQRAALERILRIAAAVLFIVVLATGIGAYSFARSVSGNLDSVNNTVNEKTEAIEALSGIELKARQLGEKIDALGTIFASRKYYSRVLLALSSSTPAEVTITGLSASDEETVSLSGETQNYVDLAKFLRALVQEDKGGALFDQANITSISLDSNTGKANFVLDLVLKDKVLRKTE